MSFNTSFNMSFNVSDIYYKADVKEDFLVIPFIESPVIGT